MINYQPRIRVTPPAGAQISYDLTTITHLTRAVVFYDRQSVEREFVDRSVGEFPLGYVVRAELEFTVPNTPQADQATLAEILGHLANPDAVVELSMGNDEFGAARYRRVAQFAETQEYHQGVLSIARYVWTFRLESTVLVPIAPGLAAVAVW